MWFENCVQCIATIPQLQADELKPEEVKKGGNDHPFDMCCYAAAWATRGAKAINMHREESVDDEFDRAMQKSKESTAAGMGAYGLRY
jgi:hypothetical protein